MNAVLFDFSYFSQLLNGKVPIPNLVENFAEN